MQMCGAARINFPKSYVLFVKPLHRYYLSLEIDDFFAYNKSEEMYEKAGTRIQKVLFLKKFVKF